RLAVRDGDGDLRAVGEAGDADVELRRAVRVERRADALLVRLARERAAVIRLERRLGVALDVEVRVAGALHLDFDLRAERDLERAPGPELVLRDLDALELLGGRLAAIGGVLQARLHRLLGPHLPVAQRRLVRRVALRADLRGRVLVHAEQRGRLLRELVVGQRHRVAQRAAGLVTRELRRNLLPEARRVRRVAATALDELERGRERRATPLVLGVERFVGRHP